MKALGGNGGFLWWNGLPKRRRYSSQRRESPKSSNSDVGGKAGGGSGFDFPLKQAATAASLALTGDAIAQVSARRKVLQGQDSNNRDVMSTILSNHDWVRALRMTSYGFLLYGPGSYAWYRFLERHLPKQSIQNMFLKVFLNQIVLGPSVIAVVFAWNNLWQRKLSELPAKYQKDALPTLVYGFRFWIPASILNFWLIPLQTRVAFMSTCSIFWNYYLSSTMSK
ncbi:protein sym-1 [Macadamia integrifolia]|uniref:protein sym-1 n=1 Tax=Macadamia integrifolia TaxID=60698 RepID=UPI001C52FED5|nr:protein sym-1 [Macadamia integrifolia]XP_042477130.1 protein sym-1 [Macadamia integrifolia]XP_042477131.1 protein sym-1 [Macadamia integrifolia]XP_042477132.1 protein sym-1 [Macadamia integrifolia]XP_042477133.1 protein sym-1 [Macadamia integrifolia]